MNIVHYMLWYIMPKNYYNHNQCTTLYLFYRAMCSVQCTTIFVHSCTHNNHKESIRPSGTMCHLTFVHCCFWLPSYIGGSTWSSFITLKCLAISLFRYSRRSDAAQPPRLSSRQETDWRYLRIYSQDLSFPSPRRVCPWCC